MTTSEASGSVTNVLIAVAPPSTSVLRTQRLCSISVDSKSADSTSPVGSTGPSSARRGGWCPLSPNPSVRRSVRARHLCNQPTQLKHCGRGQSSTKRSSGRQLTRLSTMSAVAGLKSAATGALCVGVGTMWNRCIVSSLKVEDSIWHIFQLNNTFCQFGVLICWTCCSFFLLFFFTKLLLVENNEPSRVISGA